MIFSTKEASEVTKCIIKRYLKTYSRCDMCLDVIQITARSDFNVRD